MHLFYASDCFFRLYHGPATALYAFYLDEFISTDTDGFTYVRAFHYVVTGASRGIRCKCEDYSKLSVQMQFPSVTFP